VRNGSYLAAALIVLASMAHASELPAPPPVSSFAPAATLVKLIEQYAGQLHEATASEQAYADGQSKVKKEAHTLVALALCLGLSDEEAPLKKSAPAIVAAAKQLSQATDYATAQAAEQALAAAVAGKATDGPELKWEPAASMGQLMKQVTFINARLKRGARPGPRFEKQADDNAAYATTLAAIAQVVLADTHEVKDPSQMDHWYQLNADMRDSAAAAAQALTQRDAEATHAALVKMEKSCSQCHQSFRVEVLE